MIRVVRKGSGELQELPASTDAFVWLRLYQLEMDGLIRRGGASRCGGRGGGRHARWPITQRTACSSGWATGGHEGDAAFAAAYRGVPDG